MDEAQLKQIVSRYQAGESLSQLAEAFGFRSHLSILYRLKKVGVPRRSVSEAMRGLQNGRKHQLNQRFFENIDTEAKAYWLGLLFADGWVNNRNNTIGLVSVDREIPQGLKDALRATHQIGVSIPEKGKPLHGLTIASKLMVGDLQKHGCIAAKSLVLQYPKIPTTLEHHFLRGLWDGDGCIQAAATGLSASLCGSRDLLLGVAEWLKSHGFGQVLLHPHANIWRIELNGRIHVFRFRTLLYENATVYLKRKQTLVFSDLPHYVSRVPPELLAPLEQAKLHPQFPLQGWNL